MLKQEQYECKNGTILIHTWSNKGFYIRQKETGNIYAEAYDIPNVYTYEETDEKIPEDEQEPQDAGE